MHTAALTSVSVDLSQTPTKPHTLLTGMPVYLAAVTNYQIILLGDRDTCVNNICEAIQSGVEPSSISSCNMLLTTNCQHYNVNTIVYQSDLTKRKYDTLEECTWLEQCFFQSLTTNNRKLFS